MEPKQKYKNNQNNQYKIYFSLNNYFIFYFSVFSFNIN